MKWNDFTDVKPTEDGFYLVYLSQVYDLGKSQWIWIANWNMQGEEPEFQDIHGADDIQEGARVTHWMPLPARPSGSTPERPKRPSPSVRRELDAGPYCPECGSSFTHGGILRKLIGSGCINERCDNFTG